MENAASQSDAKAVPTLPAGAIDCHMHVFGDPLQYPGAPERTYQTSEMPLDRYLPVAERLGLERTVLVQPSAYGADNRCLLAALQVRAQAARAIIVVDEQTSKDELDALDRLGVRGIRLNLMSPRLSEEAAVHDRLQAAVRRIEQFGWHIQIYADAALVAAIAPAVRRAEVAVVFDHMGGAKQGMRADAAPFSVLLDLLADDHAWVKLSGADIVTGDNSEFAGAAPYAQALIAANPDRLVWGSDWPHLVHHASGQGEAAPPAGYRPVDEAALLRHLVQWAGNAATLRKILVDNPARLYRF